MHISMGATKYGRTDVAEPPYCLLLREALAFLENSLPGSCTTLHPREENHDKPRPRTEGRIASHDPGHCSLPHHHRSTHQKTPQKAAKGAQTTAQWPADASPAATIVALPLPYRHFKSLLLQRRDPSHPRLCYSAALAPGCRRQDAIRSVTDLLEPAVHRRWDCAAGGGCVCFSLHRVGDDGGGALFPGFGG
jgi:hypothetical protein